MKKLALLLGILLLGSFLVVGNAVALSLGALDHELDIRTEGGSTSIDVYNDMLDDTSDSHWQLTASQGSINTLILEIADYKDVNNFGIYDLANPNTKLQIFSGSDSPGNVTTGFQHSLNLSYIDGNAVFTVDSDPSTVTTFSSSRFGYYLEVTATGNTYYSDTLLNTDAYDHMFAYQGVGDQFKIQPTDPEYRTWTSNEYILAWEDLYNGGDQDFTDFVVMVESVQPVPEPATMLLFGLGVLGLGVVGRKKLMK